MRRLKSKHLTSWIIVSGASVLFVAGCVDGATQSDALSSLFTTATTVAGDQAASSISAASISKDAGAGSALELTAEQQTQAQAIFDQLRTDSDALRVGTDAQIRALLTEEQAATFDELQKYGPHRGPHELPAGDASGDLAAAEIQRHVDALAEKLGLSADQQSSVGAILTDSQSKLAALHDQALAAFRALLTADQQAVFDALQAAKGPGLFGFFGDHGPRDGHGGLAVALDLTADQITQADSIFSQARTEVETLRSDADGKIRALLTEEQIAKLDELEQLRPEATFGRGPRGRIGRLSAIRGGEPPLAGGLLDGRRLDRWEVALSLTDEQKSSISTILSDLDTAIQARFDAAQEAFRAILTEDQLAKLDALQP